MQGDAFLSTRRLGKYEVVERLGRGGMAEVYRAYHVSLDRYVAIKVLHAFLADDPEFKNRFEKEARNIARLKHANIVQVYDFENDTDSESYYMVMELVEGPTLKEQLFKLNEQGTLMSLREALRIVRQAASALAYAHAQNMIHRDVKPANLMLDRDNRVVLTDFGIAKIVTGVQFTASGGMVGTPAYMAPEQGLGEAGDERSDLYSLGVILFQLVTGKLPYDAETPLAVILKHLNEPIPLARRINPDLPESIDKIITRLMAKDPDERYQRAPELIADLERVERGEVVNYSAAVPTSRSEVEEQDTRDFTPLSREVRAARAMRERRESAGAGVVPPRNRFPMWYWLLFGGIIVIGATLFILSDSASPLLAFFNSTDTPTATDTPLPTNTATEVFTPSDTYTPTETETFTLTLTPSETPVPTDTPTDTQTPLPTATNTPTLTDTATPLPPTLTYTLTPSLTLTPSNTPTLTFTPSVTPTPSITLTPTFDVTLTLLQATLFWEQQTATIAACDFDYRIVDQDPEDGDFFLAGREYTREITLQNTGTCPWERLTALVFREGENFDAEPYLFIRERVNVGETTTVTFVGRTPPAACRENNQVVICAGRWELLTPGQILIGDEPVIISVNVYEGG
jgi:serine/threonine-protein kinase